MERTVATGAALPFGLPYDILYLIVEQYLVDQDKRELRLTCKVGRELIDLTWPPLN
jgi:hypothetical protein